MGSSDDSACFEVCLSDLKQKRKNKRTKKQQNRVTSGNPENSDDDFVPERKRRPVDPPQSLVKKSVKFSSQVEVVQLSPESNVTDSRLDEGEDENLDPLQSSFFDDDPLQSSFFGDVATQPSPVPETTSQTFSSESCQQPGPSIDSGPSDRELWHPPEQKVSSPQPVVKLLPLELELVRDREHLVEENRKLKAALDGKEELKKANRRLTNSNNRLKKEVARLKEQLDGKILHIATFDDMDSRREAELKRVTQENKKLRLDCHLLFQRFESLEGEGKVFSARNAWTQTESDA